MIRIEWKVDRIGGYKYVSGQVYLTRGALSEQKIGSIHTNSRAGWLEFSAVKDNFSIEAEDLIKIGEEMNKWSELPF